LTLIDKLNGTIDGRTIWFRNVPNIVATIRAAALLPTSTIKAHIDLIAERTRNQQLIHTASTATSSGGGGGNCCCVS
jgi:hypothetical protein